MPDISMNQALEATRVFSRQFEAFATVAKALDGIVSLEAAVNDLEAGVARTKKMRDEASDALVKILGEVEAAKAALTEARANADETVSQAAKAKADADAYVKRAVGEANKIATSTIVKAEADAEAVRVAAQETLGKVEDEVIVAKAELERLNAAIADVRAKLGV